MQEIQAKALRVDELVAQIAASSQWQSRGIAQVTTAIIQMDKITQSNATSAEQSANTPEELRELLICAPKLFTVPCGHCLGRFLEAG